MLDIAIIGAGVVGGMVARELTRRGMKVVMLEKNSDVAMGATRANSGIVHAGFDAKEGTLKAKLNVRGNQMMESVCAELGVKYKNNGSLVVGFNDEDKETLISLIERGKRNGVDRLELLDKEGVRAVEPNVGEGVEWALYAGTGGIVCPYELCMAAVGNAMDNGAQLKLNFRVCAIERTGEAYKVTSSDGETVEARTVINCAGVYSDEIAALVGDSSFTVKPRRGEYVLLDRAVEGLISHTVFRCPTKMGKGVLVSPTVDGNILVGPTAEDIEDKTDCKTTAAGLSKIRALASEQVRGIDYSKTITSFTGLRSTADTGDFVINSPVEGFINVAGIESPGLTSAPAIAEYVAQLISTLGVKFNEKADFDPKRRPLHFFKELSDEQKNELIAKRPEYARIVCRCERVTEGEILDAIRANPRPTDVDGVKRRTRATMGRCQGGFCTPYIVELLSRELDIPYEKVKKCGGESYINLGRTKEDV